MTESTNPLAKYFRVPGITVRLPSKGKFQPEGNVNFSATGEVSVLPMRGLDEMWLKNPDSLMSGLAIQKVIESCVPDVKDATALPSPDFDVLLLAIRAATYGDSMPAEITCPECSTENSYEFDIRSIVETQVPLEDEYPLRINDELIAYIRPLNFRASTEINVELFNVTKHIQIIEAAEDISEDNKKNDINEAFAKLNRKNIEILAEGVERIVTPDATVTDRQFIKEFVLQADATVTHKIETELRKIAQSGISKLHTVTCHKCKHEWEAVVEFDPSSFFGEGS